jgi:cytoskeleton protein RodZ
MLTARRADPVRQGEAMEKNSRISQELAALRLRFIGRPAIRPKIARMDESLGQMLRRERELRHIALEEVAGATRISTRFLTALETDDWSELPGGVFQRGFVRTYAEYLGLNAESVLLHYQEQLKRLGTRTLVGDAAPREEGPLRDAPGLLRRFLGRWGLWIAAVAGLLALAAALHYRSTAPAAPVAAPAPVRRKPAPPPVTAAAPVVMEISTPERRVYVRLTVDGETKFQGELLKSSPAIIASGREFQLYTPSAGSLQLRVDGKIMPALGRRGEALTQWRYLAGQGVVATVPVRGANPDSAP